MVLDLLEICMDGESMDSHDYYSLGLHSDNKAQKHLIFKRKCTKKSKKNCTQFNYLNSALKKKNWRTVYSITV